MEYSANPVLVALSYLQFDILIRPLVVGEDPTQNSEIFNILHYQFWSLFLSVIAFVTFVIYLSFQSAQLGQNCKE